MEAAGDQIRPTSCLITRLRFWPDNDSLFSMLQYPVGQISGHYCISLGSRPAKSKGVRLENSVAVTFHCSVASKYIVLWLLAAHNWITINRNRFLRR